MKKEKTELLEWLKRLMEYAKDNKLSMRIIDGIDDCIKMAETRNSDLGEIKATVEELLESISYKVAPPAEKNANEEKGISIEEIREQITGMAKRCQAENAESLQNIGEQEKKIIHKTYFELQEITHCEAHMSELKSNERYLGFYEQIKISYEKQALHVFREFLSDLANNYQFMADHMKSMFCSIGGENSGFGSRRFYEEHDIKREYIAKKLETMAQDSDCGGNDIREFGNVTKGKIRKIVQKSVMRKRFFILLPILVILLVLGTGLALKYVQWERAQTEAAQEEADKDESLAIQDVIEIFIEIFYEKRDSIDKISEGMNNIASRAREIVILMIFMLLVIIVIYAAYIMMLKKICDRQICKRCNIYLQQELSQFKQKDSLSQKMDVILNDLQEEYNRQYLDLLSQLLCKSDYDISDGNSKNQFEVLKEEWNAIKYG